MSKDDFKDRLKAVWPVPEPDAGLSARIAGHVRTLEPMRPWSEVVANQIRHGLSDWRYGLSYKLAALVACMVLGLGLGMGLETPAPDLIDIVFMDAI